MLMVISQPSGHRLNKKARGSIRRKKKTARHASNVPNGKSTRCYPQSEMRSIGWIVSRYLPISKKIRPGTQRAKEQEKVICHRH